MLFLDGCLPAALSDARKFARFGLDWLLFFSYGLNFLAGCSIILDYDFLLFIMSARRRGL